MFKKIISNIRKPLITMVIMAVFVTSIPITTSAQWAVDVVADTSPTGIGNFINHQMDYLKNFVLDHLATVIAKQILHKMTMSVVNWINSGFEGSPSFLTNPAGFFIDVADQVTGAFLATNGPLSALCSPFNIDIRLSLALSQTALSDQRYTCTLSKIIEAQKNGPSVTINGKVVRSGSTMNGFLGGDFNQGGWPAFVAVTTEPQNNPYGAFLSAKSDLYAKIGAKQNTIHADLQLGKGFLSWESCKDIPQGGTLIEDVGTGNDPTMKRKNNPDGTTTFQSCETQTPGSVIAGSLQTSLDVPVVELELADDINAIIDALIGQMINQMISGGLGALSGGGGGGTGGSYTQSVINEANSTQAAQGSLDSLQASVSSAISEVDSYTAMYDQAVRVLNDSKTRYVAARACFSSKINNPVPIQSAKYNNAYIQGQIATISSQISNNIDPALNSLTAKQVEAAADRKKLSDISYSLAGAGSATAIQTQSEKYTAFVQSGGLYVQAKVDAAQTALSTAQSQAATYNAEAADMMQDCFNIQ